MKCSACGKELVKPNLCKAFEQVFCPKHYQQMLKYGHCLDSNPRTTKDLNDFEINKEKNIAKIFLYNRKSEKISEAIIDLEDLDRMIVFKWRYWRGRIYTGNTKPISLQHKVLNMEWGSDVVIDHINSNPLDNRKSNLRVISQRNNLLNHTKSTRNTTGFTGLWYDDKRDKWCAEIKKDGLKCYLGRHDKKSDAIYARYLGEVYLYGEFRSQTNDININAEISKCKNKEQIERYVKQRLKDRFNLNIE